MGEKAERSYHENGMGAAISAFKFWIAKQPFSVGDESEA